MRQVSVAVAQLMPKLNGFEENLDHMNIYIPIVIYKLPGDANWTADAIGLEGAHAEGDTPGVAEQNLTVVLKHYLQMLTHDDPMQAAELDYLARLTAPPEGVRWIVLPMTAQLEAITPHAA